MKQQKNNSKIILIFGIILILAIAAGLVFYVLKGNQSGTQETNGGAGTQATPTPIPEVQIYKGTDRPIAVMIDNNTNAWPHAGLNDAYMVYEIIVEGGETRLMALFKGVNLEKIGPVRSSRHYFLDYAMENDAIYTHFGWSPQAKSDISKFKINNINGIYEDGGYDGLNKATGFWRDRTRHAPHNALTSTNKLLAVAEKHGYRTTSDAESVLNYVTDEVLLEDGMDATYVKIPYNSYNVIEFRYDEATGRYTKYSKGKKQVESDTGLDMTTKNIIVTFASNYTLTDAENKGRQGLNNIGTLDGYYITNGKAIKITCEKTSREAKTIYKDLEGNEIKVNDGNTYVEICPKSAVVSFVDPTATVAPTSAPTE